LGSGSTDSLWGKRVIQIRILLYVLQCFFLIFWTKLFCSRSQKLLDVGAGAKKLDVWSWSLKMEYRLHSPDGNYRPESQAMEFSQYRKCERDNNIFAKDRRFPAIKSAKDRAFVDIYSPQPVRRKGKPPPTHLSLLATIKLQGDTKKRSSPKLE